MTREEAINYLQVCAEEAKSKDWGDGIRFALSFLSKREKGEYIKKEDALKKAEEWIDRTFSFGGAENKFKEFENFENYMSDLLSYSFPEREKGEWIAQYHRGGNYNVYKCSCCDYPKEYCIIGHKDNFCPNCGADMRGKAE